MSSEESKEYWKIIAGVIVMIISLVFGLEQSPTPGIQTYGDHSPVYSGQNINITNDNTINNTTNIQHPTDVKELKTEIAELNGVMKTFLEKFDKNLTPSQHHRLLNQSLELLAHIDDKIAPKVRELEPNRKEITLKNEIRELETNSKELRSRINNESNRVEQTSQPIGNKILPPSLPPQIAYNAALNNSSFGEKIEIKNINNKPNESVIHVQNLLSRAGFQIKVDGIKGKQTTNAIRDFQKDMNLEPTGEITPSLTKQLKKLDSLGISMDISDIRSTFGNNATNNSLEPSKLLSEPSHVNKYKQAADKAKELGNILGISDRSTFNNDAKNNSLEPSKLLSEPSHVNKYKQAADKFEEWDSSLDISDRPTFGNNITNSSLEPSKLLSEPNHIRARQTADKNTIYDRRRATKIIDMANNHVPNSNKSLYSGIQNNIGSGSTMINANTNSNGLNTFQNLTPGISDMQSVMSGGNQMMNSMGTISNGFEKFPPKTFSPNSFNLR